MRSSPTGNTTLLRIQQEIKEVAERENELRNLHLNHINGTANGNHETGDDRDDDEDRHRSGSSTGSTVQSPVQSPASPVSFDPMQRSLSSLETSEPPTRIFQRASSTPGMITGRKFIQNTSTQRGVMQKFFKMRGKVTTVATIQQKPSWSSLDSDVVIPPKTATGKPIRKGYVPVEEKIQSELRDLKNREEALRMERRQSQPDLMAALEREQEEENSSLYCSSPSPVPPIGKLRNAKSFTQLNEDLCESPTNFNGLKPAKSLAELCDAGDDEIESPRSLIQQWEMRIKQSQEN